MRICWILFSVSLLIVACSSGGGGQDGGFEDGADADAGGDDAGNGDAPQDGTAQDADGGGADESGSDTGPRPDYDPNDSFLVVVPAGTVLDESTMMGFAGGGIQIDGGDILTGQQALGPCSLSDGWKRVVTAAVSGGDRLVLDVRGSMPCMISGNTTCYLLFGAEVTLGGGQMTVDEHFRLVYSAGHHNEGEEFLVVLDPPVGQNAALLLVAPPLLSPDGGELVYLDSDLAELAREPLSEWQSTF